MGYINLFVESGTALSVKNDQLVIAAEPPRAYPLEDIGCVLLESRRSTLTSDVISRLSCAGASLIFCDEKCMPCACTLPLYSHSRHLLVLKKQIALRKFLLKDGFHMVQYSVYARVCNGSDSVETHKRRIYENRPDNGSVRVLVVTEKQYQSIDIIVGKSTEPYDDPPEPLVFL